MTISVMLPPETTLEDVLDAIQCGVAVDASGANLRGAIADAYGHAWRIFFITMVAMLPFIIVAVAGKVILQGSIASDAVIAFGAFDAIVFLVGCTLFAMMASRVYQWIGRTSARSTCEHTLRKGRMRRPLVY